MSPVAPTDMPSTSAATCVPMALRAPTPAPAMDKAPAPMLIATAAAAAMARIAASSLASTVMVAVDCTRPVPLSAASREIFASTVLRISFTASVAAIETAPAAIPPAMVRATAAATASMRDALVAVIEIDAPEMSVSSPKMPATVEPAMRFSAFTPAPASAMPTWPAAMPTDPANTTALILRVLAAAMSSALPAPLAFSPSKVRFVTSARTAPRSKRAVPSRS